MIQDRVPKLLALDDDPTWLGQIPSVRKQASKVIVFLRPLSRAKIDHGLASPAVVSSSPLLF